MSDDMDIRSLSFILSDFEGASGDPLPDAAETIWGITWPTYKSVIGPSATHNNHRALTREQAISFYQVWLLRGYRLSEIADQRLRFAVLDFAINSGPRRAIRALQKAVGGVGVDGAIGTETLRAVNRADAIVVWEKLNATRLRWLAQTKEIRAANVGGWLNRMAMIWEKRTI